MKKTLSFILAAVLCMGMLSACGSSKSEAAPADTATGSVY